jgi:hypothetical protein
VDDHLGHLRRVALQNGQMHLGEALFKLRDSRRQRITGLRVRRGDHEITLILRRVIFTDALQALHFLQDFFHRCQDNSPRFG